MPFFMGLFTVIYPLLKLFSGVVAFALIYDLLSARLYPLLQMAQTKLSSTVSGSGSVGCGDFCEIMLFFDLSRAVTVLTSAMVLALAWKVVIYAARSMAARAAPGL